MTEKLGRYEIIDKIGQGGFAVVYRAHDTRLDRLVALKELRPTLLSDADSVKHFRQEARNIARLDHPKVVTIYDVYEAQQRLFIVMQLVDGSSLADLIARQGRLAWPRTVEIITAVAEGLDYAHTRGVLHRDLKPANILLDSNHGPMLSDFGLAKLIGEASTSVTAGGGIVGTPHYIAPEVWDGRGTTRQSDVYALGCILYEMLTGEKVFAGETPPAVMMAHFRELTLPMIWPESVPSGVTDVLDTALAKKTADRYGTADEMVQALAALTTLVSSELTTPQPGQARSETIPVSAPILTTKLNPPRTRRKFVLRPRLIGQLNEGLHRKLTLISAPAGFGKTTLVSDWLSQNDERGTMNDESDTKPIHHSSFIIHHSNIAWLSLDENDSDLTRFLTYVIAALQQIDPNIGQTVQGLLQSLPAALATPAIESLITTLGDRQCVFVLDDYHVIESPPIDQALTFLLDHLPPQMHLVIATRIDPSLPLSRLRVRDQIVELRADDLRFTLEEATTFLNTMMRVKLSPEHVATLESRTEGWIAGLQLAALSLQGLKQNSDITGFINSLTGSHRYIIDYLADEVLQQRPPGTKDFLLQTSILGRLSGPLCDAVIDSPPSVGPGPVDRSGQAILEALEAANLFLVALDYERRWYRYHHLFADLLKSRLEASQPDLVPTLHRRASAWYAQNDLMSEAIAHSLAGDDLDRAAQLTEQTFFDLMSRGEDFVTMLARLEALPDKIIRARPRLGILYAWMSSITLQLDSVEPRLQEVERMAGDQLPADLKLQIAHIRAELARQRGDYTTAIERSHQVLEALPEKLSETDGQTLTGALFNLVWAYLGVGDVANARPWLSQTLAVCQEAKSLTLTVVALRGLAQLHELQGQLHQAAETCRQALQLTAEAAERSGQPVPAAAYAHLGLGNLLREWNELDEAECHLAQGMDLGRNWQVGPDTLREGYLFQIRLKQAQGDLAGAWDVLRQAQELAQACQTIPGFGDPIVAHRAQLMLAQATATGRTRELKGVEEWVAVRGLSLGGSINTLNDEREYLTWVRLLMARNESNRALQVLARLLPAAEEAGRRGHVMEIWILQALTRATLGQTEPALNTLARALAEAEPEGYIRLFVDEGPPMVALLRKAASRGIASNYVSKLLPAFAVDEQQLAPLPLPPTTAAPQLIEPLSDRELNVLRLLNTDLSGPEIAAELIVSVNTIKTHIKHIYGKLNAHSRYEAVERAKQLDLLE
jgi:LuxR family maltose regulon positive regulatory protein